MAGDGEVFHTPAKGQERWLFRCLLVPPQPRINIPAPLRARAVHHHHCARGRLVLASFGRRARLSPSHLASPLESSDERCGGAWRLEVAARSQARLPAARMQVWGSSRTWWRSAARLVHRSRCRRAQASDGCRLFSGGAVLLAALTRPRSPIQRPQRTHSRGGIPTDVCAMCSRRLARSLPPSALRGAPGGRFWH